MAQTSRSSPAIGGAVPTQWWRTITSQRMELESANAELEVRVADQVEDLRQALEEGRRRVDAFRTAAEQLALEEVPERALQQQVDAARELIGASYSGLALFDSESNAGKFVTSGLSEEQQAAVSGAPSTLEDMGLSRNSDETVTLSNATQYMKAHGFSEDHAPITSFLGVPITVRGKQAGAFYVMDEDSDHSYSEDDERILDLFAIIAGVHLENVELYDDVAREQRTLAAIQGSMTEGLIVLDPDAKVVYANESAEKLWNVQFGEIEGESFSEVMKRKSGEFASPEDVDSLVSIAFRTGDSSSTVGVTIDSPQRLHLEITSFAIPTGSDQFLTGLLARDVTEARQLQDRRDTFVSIASHELRTPMTTIMGFSELLLNNKDAPESSRRGWLERVHQNSQTLSSIVDDMLNVSRIQSGRLEINIEQIDVKDLVGEAIEGIRRDAGDKYDFVTDVPPGTPQVFADRDKFTQIVINLLTNAVKYTPDGGSITVSVNHEPDRERVVVEVRDEGMGIAPENLESLFASFHRIRRPETEGIRGTGLGLSIVKGLVNLIRGEVWVETELDKGSSFFFTVPTTKADSESAEERRTLSTI